MLGVFAENIGYFRSKLLLSVVITTDQDLHFIILNAINQAMFGSDSSRPEFVETTNR